ncbi:hypothetical protein [Planomonospora sp. ID82291]|uniref:hypothetical protein n=1 Tax=Planomonospora sp. ID82291 TaxID=2738136 RepID=UPI0018C3A9C3|nr:hypothetical protein [Planomonospora sp. ID82291]MBG0818782.1 hypothetical protein [Planomonospora sp. ID82291]
MPAPDRSRVNIPLLLATMRHIETHPDLWWQEDHRGPGPDGDILDFAARAADLAGGRWAYDPIQRGAATQNYLEPEPGDDMSRAEPIDGRLLIGVWERAKRILGLDDEDAAELFRPDADLEDLQAVVAAVAGHPVPEPGTATPA